MVRVKGHPHFTRITSSCNPRNLRRAQFPDLLRNNFARYSVAVIINWTNAQAYIYTGYTAVFSCIFSNEITEISDTMQSWLVLMK